MDTILHLDPLIGLAFALLFWAVIAVVGVIGLVVLCKRVRSTPPPIPFGPDTWSRWANDTVAVTEFHYESSGVDRFGNNAAATLGLPGPAIPGVENYGKVWLRVHNRGTSLLKRVFIQVTAYAASGDVIEGGMQERAIYNIPPGKTGIMEFRPLGQGGAYAEITQISYNTRDGGFQVMDPPLDTPAALPTA